MSDQPRPEVSEADYDTIAAAVTQSQRGRSFLAEYARRQRAGEMDRLLDAVGRIEQIVCSTAGPNASPTIRTLVQRVGVIGRRLGDLATEMRASGAEPRFIAAVEQEARLVADVLRAPGPAGSGSQREAGPPTVTRRRGDTSAADGAAAITEAHVGRHETGLMAEMTHTGSDEDDPRLDALSGLDQLTLAEKLALFA